MSRFRWLGPLPALVLPLALFFTSAPPAGEGRPRLVSLAPSLTEMVFALGAGELLAGVTTHCRYPPEALAIPKIGGYLTPDFEAVIALRPDLVLALAEHSPAFPIFDSLGLARADFDHRSLDGLLESLVRLGGTCRREAAAGELRGRLAAALAPPEGYREASAPSLLLLISRDHGKGVIANAIAIGRDGLYDKLIAAVGCRNAYRGDLPYPALSGEGVALLNPDLVVEATQPGEEKLSDAELLADWRALSRLAAVREGRVRHLRSDYAFIPGLRMLDLKRELADLAAAGGLVPESR